MKKLLAVLAVTVPFYAVADPRMEINDNFCHFVHNNVDADDETFAAGCNATISVQQGSANGYGKVVRLVPLGYLNFDTPVIESDATAPQYTCTMVESNGIAYTSNEWESTIKTRPSYRWQFDINRNKERIINGYHVTYELICKNGVAQ